MFSKKTKKILLELLVIILLSMGITIIRIPAYASSQVGKATISTDSLNVRKGPGKEYEAIGKVYLGNEVEVTAVEGEWLKIIYNDTEGYISIDYVQYEPSEEEIALEEENDGISHEDAKETDETEEAGIERYKKIFGLLGAMVVLAIIILLTIRSIKNMDDEDDYDDDEDEEYDDESDDEDEDDYDEDGDDEDDESEEDDDEYEYVVVRRPKRKNDNISTPKRSSDDFLIDIDPKYFE